MNKEESLGHLRGEQEKLIGALVYDLAQLAWETNRPQATDFLDPYERKVARSVLGGLPEIGFFKAGGYKKAERARLMIYPQYYLLETLEAPIKVLQAEGNFSFNKVGHKDFLGSILGTGLKREKVGDIIVLPGGCQAVVAAEVAKHLLLNWKRVGPVPVEVVEIDEGQLNIEPERIKEIRATVASLRLDAVAAEGFGMSRTRMAREIKAEKIKLNWQLVSNPALSVESGDTLSMRGRGRVLLHS
ncbi:MAG TPA: photosystem II S4 domain protein, partial [Firmicutes bacterium]|nr:photosystem II S4 domain protein [Bacillota bacterium]